MAWDQLSINKPHLVYIILGGFTSIFMLVSLFIKEKLYIGEATVATICGLIFGPHAANLINPLSWGNTDQITLEFSRIVLVVQCFAVGVELPKAYMERHWRSVLCLLVPVMTFGWLITSLFIWWLIEPLTWLESLCCAACVTATDPVLASSVVGKGKFAKRVPKHIRDLLSAESGCNDGMAFPFIYLALNLIHYHLDAKHVTQHWFVNTILYECVWGAVYGVLVGYIARQAIKWAERRGIIDRESFLVFYFVLALFCAGSGSLLGMDDLLIGFAAGVGFSNDGWFTEKTEESHVSNVIDLLLNLTYFVYLGTIIPWDQFNASEYGLDAWRLVVIALLVIFFRRIPIMLALKPIIPDIKTWREALFCGHFGPIGVGAIFVAILARAELETDTTTPLAQLPPRDDPEYALIYAIWPITTFLVIASIVVHGSSIAVFTLGKRINTLTMTLSYTKDNDNSSNWMDRLPRIASRSKSQGKSFDSEFSEDDKDYPPGTLPTSNLPPLQLRRQKESDDAPYRPSRRSRSKKRRSKKMYGGPVSDSAIAPQRPASEPALTHHESGSETLNEKSERASDDTRTLDRSEKPSPNESDEEGAAKGGHRKHEEENGDNDVEVEAYEERNHLIVEDEEGNVLESVNTEGRSPEEKRAIVDQAKARLKHDSSGKFAHHKHENHAENEEDEITDAVKDTVEHPQKNFFKSWKGFGRHGGGESSKKEAERKRGPAHAYQIGRTIIVEDEDGEVIHKYDIPREDVEPNKYNEYVRERLQRMGTLVGLGPKVTQDPQPLPPRKTSKMIDDIEDSSSPSPDKEMAPQAADKAQADSKEKPKQPARTNTGGVDDLGLRMIISNTESYGLTGLRKPKPGERPPAVGGGRRMSTQDFLQHVSKLDQKDQEKLSIGERKSSGIAGKSDAARPQAPNRAGTLPMGEPTAVVEERGSEAGDYFSNHQSEEGVSEPTGTRQRARSDVGRSRPSEMAATQSQPTASGQADSDEEDEEASDVPTFNLRDSIRKRGQASGAEARRRQYSSAVAPGDDKIEEEDESDDERETAAERKRRLAALGKGDDNARDSDSDGEGPRATHGAVPEPDREPEVQTPRQRIQWGGETRGQVYGQAAPSEAEQAEQAGSSSGRRKFKKFLNR